MIVSEIRKKLMTMKIHVDQLDDWVRQATDVIYEIEEKLMDIEDKEYSQKYNFEDTIDFFKDAAPKINQIIDCPPRLSGRCSNDHIAASGFFQSDFDLKKII